jgi:cellobiose phosphorylase
MDGTSLWHELSLKLSLHGDQPDIAAVREILPWYGMNALTHFLTPYGLEQFSGAAWGTRDVAQGPLDLLLTMEKYEEARQVLKIIFSNQNPNGGWPQWWMFDSYQYIRADSSHGDIFYWCIIALAKYIRTTGDMNILDEMLPYYRAKGSGPDEVTPLSEHVDRLIGMIIHSFIPGTALVPFDGGDWNDSLQPVSKELAQRMISSWTVEMNYQAFSDYRHIYEKLGDKKRAAELLVICDKIRTDFNKYLIRDGVVAGYGLMEADGSVRVLLHPSDNKTGIHYSILPIERGIISGIFTREQALLHRQLIEDHLKGPDGARLMDRPLKYKGGIQEIFQRAESSTHFGREIGLMYIHEHIRYAESLARTGHADAFVKALRQAIPVGYRDIVPCGDIRQANCYYSSSDVAFRNRYEADERYDDVKAGIMTLRGGWRVYSSGPGIYISLVVTGLLGLRIEDGNVIIDPVMPDSLDGLSASIDFLGRRIRLNYSIKEGNYGPKAISINGAGIHFTFEDNPFRQGGAVIDKDQFTAKLVLKENIVAIRL